MPCYYLCRCEPCIGGNRTDPAVEAMFRTGLLRQVWNDHESLTSLVVAKYREENPHPCLTEITRGDALGWLSRVDAGKPVEYVDPAGLLRMTERIPVERILARHEEGM